MIHITRFYVGAIIAFAIVSICFLMLNYSEQLKYLWATIFILGAIYFIGYLFMGGQE